MFKGYASTHQSQRDPRRRRVGVRARRAALQQVGQTRPCTGTFRLTHDGQHADYRLTRHAATFLNMPGSIMHKVAAHTTHALAGLPSSTGRFSGFYPKEALSRR
jgi:hypothetical protein